MYEFYIEKQRVDIDQTLSIQLSYAIDDIRQFGSRNTSFSKSISLPGTARNNKAFGHIVANTSSNPYSIAIPNFDVNFNPADISFCEIRLNGLLVLKGIFRLTGYKLLNGVYQYEGNVFGELGGFVNAIANKRLQDLDFSEYDHVYNASNIQNSWDSINGSGYYYPLIDYGTYSTNKVDYDIRTFRPALYVKEYIDKIFTAAGYTYESAFLETAFFKSLIIPHNSKQLTKLASRLLTAELTGGSLSTSSVQAFLSYDTAIGGNFNINVGNNLFTWNVADPAYVRIVVTITATYTATDAFSIILIKNGIEVDGFSFPDAATSNEIDITLEYEGLLENADTLRIKIENDLLATINITGIDSLFTVDAQPPTISLVDVGDDVSMNDTIPKGVFQKDFFSWVLRMFNLYVDEDKLIDKHLIIEPYVDYYNYNDVLDWSQKIDYSKQLNYTPMGQLNGRFFEYKYSSDNDFYNEGYQKKFNQNYGDILYDTGFPFSKDRETVEIGFAPTPLVQYNGTDKILPAIYKKSTGNDIDQEELMDSKIRILIAKKITGVTGWDILDGVSVLASISSYGYGGHLDDPSTPTLDLNFGVPSEIYFTVVSYTGNGLYNTYWSDYINEIANKDSKILSCYAYLKGRDIADLDFSKPVYISGSLWRINKIEDYDGSNPVTRVELLKLING